MLESVYELIQRQFNRIVLRTYQWRSRKYPHQGRFVVQWQDPLSALWYPESTALRLVKGRVLEEMSTRYR